MIAPARGRVVEIGAGTGLDFAHYSGEAWVVATDPNMTVLERACSRIAVSARKSCSLSPTRSSLYRREAPERTVAGIVITALSVVVMPLLARAKRRVGIASEAAR